MFYVLPFYPQPSIPVYGDTKIYLFGVLVAIGVLVGRYYTQKRADAVGINRNDMDNAIWWAVGTGFVLSHWVEIFFYKPWRIEQEGFLVIFKLFDGMSSYGGFWGAAIGLTGYFWFTGRRKWWLHADCIIQGLVIGWIFGRLGCTFAHDHPGQLSQFPLAVDYPGGARHNLGFYEMLYTVFILTPLILVMRRFPIAPGGYVFAVCMAYAPVRFYLDFLRSTDKEGSDLRYFGLTFAQYSSIALFFISAFILWKLKKGDLKFQDIPKLAAVSNEPQSPKKNAKSSKKNRH